MKLPRGPTGEDESGQTIHFIWDLRPRSFGSGRPRCFREAEDAPREEPERGK